MTLQGRNITRKFFLINFNRKVNFQKVRNVNYIDFINCYLFSFSRKIDSERDMCGVNKEICFNTETRNGGDSPSFYMLSHCDMKTLKEHKRNREVLQYQKGKNSSNDQKPILLTSVFRISLRANEFLYCDTLCGFHDLYNDTNQRVYQNHSVVFDGGDHVGIHR